MPRKRTTVTYRIGPEEWKPICRWLNDWLDQVKDPPGLFLEKNTRQVLDRLIRKANRTKATEDLTLRLSLDDTEEIRQQMAFWECAQDEINKDARRQMPDPGIFAAARWEADYVLSNP